MIFNRILVPEKTYRAVDFETRKSQKKNQNSLCPVPEPFERLIYVYSLFHIFFLFFFDEIILIVPCKNTPASVKYNIAFPVVSIKPLLSLAGI